MLEEQIAQFQSISLDMDKSSVRSGSRSPDSGSDKGNEREETRRGRKHRRGKHRRKWKPYCKMTMEEKRALEAREAARAAKREAKLVGKPAAPWNTTQFIMEDRGLTEVRIPSPRASRTTSIESSLSDEDYYESPEEELEHGLFLEQDFESVFQEAAAERLQGMSKTELIEECLHLEHEMTVAKDDVRNDCNAIVEKLQRQLSGVQEDNQKLREENLRLRKSNQHVCEVSS